MAGNSILGWTNYAKAATIIAGSSATNLPPTNVATDSGSSALGWQTVYGVTTIAGGAVLTITPVVTHQTWDALACFKTNLTAGASVTFTLWNSPSTIVWTTTAVGPVSGYGQVIALPPAATVADYCTIGFNDSSNTDGFINVPLVYVGSVWRPLGSVSYASTLGRDATVSEATTRGGQEYPSLFYQRRRWNVQLDAMRSSEVWTQSEVLNQYASAGSNVLFIPDITSSYINQETLFGRLKHTADVTWPYGVSGRRRWTTAITERL
jgi:hypothetical protein